MKLNFYIKNLRKVVLFLSVFLFSSCVYFNTFYNAKVAYKDALRIINLMNYTETQIPAESKRLLDLSIANSRMVLEKYPNSKYVEEAYYLLASSMYLKEDYLSSKEYLDILISNYPNGDYYNEGKLRLASIYVKENNLISANEVIKKLSAYKLNRYETYLLNTIYAEIHVIDESIELAYKSYQDAINNAGNDSERIKIYNKLIQLSERQKDYENLLVFIDGLYENLSNDSDKKELKLLSLEYNKRLKKYDYLTYEIQDMLNQSLFEDKRMFLSVELAKAYYYLEDYSTTEELLLEIVDIYSRKNETAEAYYFLAQIDIKNDFNLETIKELLNKSKAERSSSKYGKLSKELIRKLDDLETLIYEYNDKNPSERSPDKDSLLFTMGQSYYFDFNQIDSAISKHSELTFKFPSSRFTPKSLFVLSILDSTNQNWLERLESEYPDNYSKNSDIKSSSNNYYSKKYYEALSMLELGLHEKAYPILKTSYLNNKNKEALFYLGYINEIYTYDKNEMIKYYIEYINSYTDEANCMIPNINLKSTNQTFSCAEYAKKRISMYYYIYNKDLEYLLLIKSLYDCLNSASYKDSLLVSGDECLKLRDLERQSLSDTLMMKLDYMELLPASKNKKTWSAKWNDFKETVEFIDEFKLYEQHEKFYSEIRYFADKVYPVEVNNSQILGDKNAPTSIVWWFDFQNPYCARSVELINEILYEYEGEVNIVTKNFPLSFHKQAMVAAKYALAAARQEKYSEMFYAIFNDYKELKENENFLIDLALSLELDIEKLNSDLEDPAIEAQILKEMEEMKNAGFDRIAVPKFLIDGKLPLKRDFISFSSIIDGASATETSIIGATLEEGNVEIIAMEEYLITDSDYFQNELEIKELDNLIRLYDKLEPESGYSLSNYNKYKRRAKRQSDYNKVYNIEDAGSIVLGNKNAPITIIEWVDFECPYCAKSVRLVDDILEKYPNDVKVLIKNFPLVSFHEQAMEIAKYTLAADKQGKYKEMYYAMMGNFYTSIEDAAKSVGLDFEKLTSDASDPAIKVQIDKEISQLKESGIPRIAVPKFLVAGKEPEGRNLKVFSEIIDEELDKTSNSNKSSGPKLPTRDFKDMNFDRKNLLKK